jgi:hypothetical protein
MAMFDLDELELGWGEYATVWVRPAEGRNWHKFKNGSYGVVAKEAWMPAVVTGFQDEGSRERYNTINDPRRVQLVGEVHGYLVSAFEFMPMEDAPKWEPGSIPVSPKLSVR